MLNRRLASLIAAVSIAGLAAAGCSEQSAAIRVDDATVSRSDFEDQLDRVYDSEESRRLLFQAEVAQSQLRGEGDPPGSYRQEYVGAMVSFEVETLLIEKLLDDEGIEVPDDVRAQVEDEFRSGSGLDVDALPAEVRDPFLDRQAGISVLQSELGDGYQAAVQRVVNGTTVELDSRYGTWDATQFRMEPPAGPRPAPGSEPEGPQVG